MYERFTDRARLLMLFANQEAQRLNHAYIGTEHILLGLIREGSGVAANVLKNLDVILGKLTSDVERLLQRGPLPVAVDQRLAQTMGARDVIKRAIEESHNLRHNYVGTEHILLGLMEDHEGLAGKILDEQGLTPEEVRHEIQSLLGHGIRPMPTSAERFTEVEDLPETLKVRVAEFDAEIRQFTREKEGAVANQDFETAARFRDEADKTHRERRTLVREWFASHVADPSWLTANDGTVQRLAEMIKEKQWWNLLPDLADALELAGCNDIEVISHCRSGARHSSQCWVVELLVSALTAE